MCTHLLIFLRKCAWCFSISICPRMKTRKAREIEAERKKGRKATLELLSLYTFALLFRFRCFAFYNVYMHNTHTFTLHGILGNARARKLRSHVACQLKLKFTIDVRRLTHISLGRHLSLAHTHLILSPTPSPSTSYLSSLLDVKCVYRSYVLFKLHSISLCNNNSVVAGCCCFCCFRMAFVFGGIAFVPSLIRSFIPSTSFCQ